MKNEALIPLAIGIACSGCAGFTWTESHIVDSGRFEIHRTDEPGKHCSDLGMGRPEACVNRLYTDKEVVCIITVPPRDDPLYFTALQHELTHCAGFDHP